MALVASNLDYPVQKLVTATLAFDSSYPTGGEQISASAFGLSRFSRIMLRPTGAAAGGAGYVFDATISADGTTAKILVVQSAGFTPAGTNSAPSFTGSALAAHRHTFFLNNAEVADGATTRVNAGTNLLGANTGSDISVAGVADTTGHGGVVDVTAGTPAGTVAAPTFTGTAVSAGAFVEVGNTTDLSALTAVPGDFFGY